MKHTSISAILVLAILYHHSPVYGQEEGGGEEPSSGHDQPPPENQNQIPDKENQDPSNKGTEKPANEQGFTQGFNQGVKPYSYGYNTGIKPYAYDFYQPMGGKPQVVERKMDDPKPNDANSGSKGQQQPAPTIPTIDFPADFSAFGLSPADLAIPPPPSQQGKAGQTSGQQAPIPFSLPPTVQPVSGGQGSGGQTPPPFNLAEYGIPTDIGSATGSASGSPFGLLGSGGPQRQAVGLDGDDFGIFGTGNNNNNNNGNSGFTIPVLEDNNNQNNQQQGLGIPLFGGGSPAPAANNDFNFANSDLNDFNVAASDFEPFNFQNFVPPEFARTVGPIGSLPPGVPSGVPRPNAAALTSRQQQAALSNHKQHPTHSHSDRNKSQLSLMERKQMYKPLQTTADNGKKKMKRSVDEQPHEKKLKDDPHSAWYILNMDPQYTNPNQGVYSYYPAYRTPS